MPRALNSRQLRKRARDFVLKQSYPRLTVTVMLICTAVTGFLCSSLLLRFGVKNMAVRYGVASILAYAAFFLYMRLLVYWFFRRTTDKPTLVDRIDEEYGEDIVDVAVDVVEGAAGKTKDSGVSGIGDLFGDSDFLVVIVAAVMLIGSLFASFYVIYAAPELLFEVVMDAFVGLGVFKMLRNEQRKHWAESTFRKTVWPFAVTFVLMTGGGYLIQQIAPHAVKMKDIFH